MRAFFFGGKTFGAILDERRGAGGGFDMLRIGLAVVILFSHCSALSGNGHFLSQLLASLFHTQQPLAAATRTASDGVAEVNFAVVGLARPFTLSHVPMFFALSGFLVTGSAFRTANVFRFLGLRALRIFPALVVEVSLSALVLGAVFTTLPLKDYFTSAEFFRYFGNMVGWVTFDLPGVFQHTSTSTQVNANLWTLPAEFDCYAIAAALIVFKILFNRKLYTILFGAATAVLLLLNTFFGFQVVDTILPESVITYYFLVGVLFFLWRDKIVYNVPLFVLCVAACYGLMMSPRTVYIYPLLLTYITVFIGVTPFPEIKFLKSGDYSYGIYLYGYPLTQAIIAAVPAIRGNFAAILVSSLAAGTLFAFFSWHLVEKRVLALKKYLSPRSAEIANILHADAAKPAVPRQAQV